MTAAAKPIYSVQVRELVEFALRGGDLGGERVFAGRGRALAGTLGHVKLQRSRPASYQKEVSVRHEISEEEFTLRVQGRIDGLFIAPGEVMLEEIKTVQGVWRRQANPLHWAQAKIYGFIYCLQQSLETITLRLTYLELETGSVTEFTEIASRGELSRFFEEAMAIYLDWIRERHRWLQARDKSIQLLEFPFSVYRPGQRELAVAAYRTLARGGRLFLEAPTGIGKTMAVLFPAIKALGEGGLEQIFYLTARTVGRTVAEKAFADLRQAGLRLQTLTLTAREKLCVRDGVACDPSTCPFAIGYYDRDKPAMRAALEQESITRPVLEAVGRDHQVCPFELGLDLSGWVDAIICDYNYVFDPKAYLKRHFSEEARDYAFLIDEAHNLGDRAREMFSAELDSSKIQEVRRAIRGALPRCARALTRLHAAMQRLCDPAAKAMDSTEGEELAAPDLFTTKEETTPAPARAPVPSRAEEANTLARAEFPAELLPPLDEALNEAEAWLVQNQPAEFRDALLELFFELHSFRRTAELYDECYVTILKPGRFVTARLFCLDPSNLLRTSLERGKAAIFFSATLTPIDYHRSLLGGAGDDPVLQLSSPFDPENLAVLVQDRLRTNYKARAETLSEVVEAILALVQARRGNYLVYLPSYQYLTSVEQRFQSLHPGFRALVQRPGMTEAERDAFLRAFAEEHEETLVGFAVMGGIFGEGIDLVGERLIGAVVVGVGLPQLCVERDLIGNYFQEKNGAGFDYAYTFPGMNRVLQASGRVIRSETDRGVVLLIDTRFGEARYRRLFARGWQPVRVRSAGDIQEAASAFWNSC